jgi:hypothetical protein
MRPNVEGLRLTITQRGGENIHVGTTCAPLIFAEERGMIINHLMDTQRPYSKRWEKWEKGTRDNNANARVRREIVGQLLHMIFSKY